MQYVITYAEQDQMHLIGQIVEETPKPLGVIEKHSSGLNPLLWISWVAGGVRAEAGFYPEKWLTPNTPPDEQEKTTGKEIEQCG